VREAVPLDVFVVMTRAETDLVVELRDRGLLDLDSDGLFDDIDVLRLAAVTRCLEHGYTVEKLEAEVRDGTLDVFLGELLFDTNTYTVEAAVEQTGLDAAHLRALLAALGLPEARLSKGNLELLGVVRLALSTGLPFEGILETARVFGDSMRRIADAAVRLLHVHMHERLIASGVPEREVNEQMVGVEDALAPLVDSLLVGLHHDHLLQAAIEDVLLHTAEPRFGWAPGSIEVTIVFVDLASFTMLTETEGDEAAVRVLARVEELMRPLVLRHDGRVVKQIGDGFMLAFRDPADAVRATLALRDALDEPAIPPIRAGINTGIAVFRGSDYIGSTVNVASRVVGAAMAGHVLLTATTAERIADEGIPVEEVGVRLMRGVDEPLALYRPSVTLTS
jgi:adenylate cyclase